MFLKKNKVLSSHCWTALYCTWRSLVVKIT
jgi:hypothetical protein